MLFRSGQGGELAAWYRQAFADGLNPQHPARWDRPTGSMHQALVESASLAFNLVLARRELWDPLPVELQDGLERWLRECVATFDRSINNWNLFVILIELALQQLGRPHNEANVTGLLAEVEKMYHGDGWYADGYYRQFDYYVPWAMQTYLLIAAKWRGGEFQRTIHERAAQFAQDYAWYFDSEGRHIPYGRSLTYRFSAAAFWSTAAWCEVPGIDPVQCREIAARNIAFFLNQPIFDEADRVTTGFAYPNSRINEGYISYASPYWCGKAFLLLALPEEHPVWHNKTPHPDLLPAPRGEKESKSVSLSLPGERVGVRGRVAQKHLSIPNLIITRSASGRNVTLYNGGAHHPFDLGSFAAKYGKFAYSSHFGFNLPDDTGASFDNMICLSLDGKRWSHRIRFEICPNQGDWLVSRHQPFPEFPDTIITTALRVVGPWHFRVHRLRLDREFIVREGGMPVACATDQPLTLTLSPQAERGNTEVASFSPSDGEKVRMRGLPVGCFRGDNGASGIWCRKGAGQPVRLGPFDDLNVLYRRVFVPALEARLPAGIHESVSACFADVVESPRPQDSVIPELNLERLDDGPLNIVTGAGRTWP